MDAARRRAAAVAGHVCGGGIPADGAVVALPEHLKDGEWRVRRSALSPKALVDHLELDPMAATLYDVFQGAVARYPDREYLGTRAGDDGKGPYEWTTYAEAAAERDAFASWLMGRAGCAPGASVGIYMVNRREWAVADLACAAAGLVSVPLYDTLGPDVAEYVLTHAECVAVVCSTHECGKLQAVLPRCPGVGAAAVAAPRPSGPEASASAAAAALPLPVADSYSAAVGWGRAHPAAHRPPRPGDVATIVYTSGTTGMPKGAVVTHHGLVATAAGSALRIPPPDEPDTHISYLPLAHIYERCNMLQFTSRGTRVGFYAGDMNELLGDVQALRPTIFCSVPRLYNRIYDAVAAQVRQGGALKQRLFGWAMSSKLAAMRSGRRPNPVWERLVFAAIRDKLGGRVRLMTTGASPIAAEVLDFLRAAFGCEVIEGYGMTEAGIASMTVEGERESGHVGAPCASCEIKLDDVPEMGYTSDDRPFPRGEICIRGPSVFKGYHKEPGKTAEAIDGEGWLHTGDVGMWLPGGKLKIIDRKKNIFKLAQGEYVAPEKIENVYARSELVQQAYVHGDSLQPCLVAVLVPDPEAVAARFPGCGGSAAAACQDPAVLEAMHESVLEQGRRAGLQGFEQARAVSLHPDAFSVDNGLLTPTFKLKRPQAREFFARQIRDMYASIK